MALRKIIEAEGKSFIQTTLAELKMARSAFHLLRISR